MKKTVWIKSLKCSVEVTEENRAIIEMSGFGNEFEHSKELIKDQNDKNNPRATKSLISDGNGIGNKPEPVLSVRDKKHSKKQLESDLKQQSIKINNSLKAEFEKSDLFFGKNAVVDAETITDKLNKTIVPEAWDDNGDEDL
jgi:hypothetical protein